ncbi:MAG: hypothetical protein ACREOK_02190 [Gemmatimonadaceae bacterium]
MSVAFVRQLRARRLPLELGPPGPESVSFRVQAAEHWDAIRVIAPQDMTVGELKNRMLATFYPDYEYPDEFVFKLRGWEMLDENAPIGQSGIANGSIILLGDRRRRPVR